jgi:hypothetical protein
VTPNAKLVGYMGVRGVVVVHWSSTSARISYSLLSAREVLTTDGRGIRTAVPQEGQEVVQTLFMV